CTLPHRSLPSVPTRRSSDLIMEGEGEHPPQPLQHLGPPGLVAFQDDFGIAARAEGMPGGLQLRAQLRVVVDFAVEDQGEASATADHGLIAGRHVDDAEPAMAQDQTVILVEAALIRTPVEHGRAHPFAGRTRLGTEPAAGAVYSAYAAHRKAKPPASREGSRAAEAIRTPAPIPRRPT